jgi:hypothetical protein
LARRFGNASALSAVGLSSLLPQQPEACKRPPTSFPCLIPARGSTRRGPSAPAFSGAGSWVAASANAYAYWYSYPYSCDTHFGDLSALEASERTPPRETFGAPLGLGCRPRQQGDDCLFGSFALSATLLPFGGREAPGASAARARSSAGSVAGTVCARSSTRTCAALDRVRAEIPDSTDQSVARNAIAVARVPPTRTPRPRSMPIIPPFTSPSSSDAGSRLSSGGWVRFPMTTPASTCSFGTSARSPPT